MAATLWQEPHATWTVIFRDRTSYLISTHPPDSASRLPICPARLFVKDFIRINTNFLTAYLLHYVSEVLTHRELVYNKYPLVVLHQRSCHSIHLHFTKKKSQ